MKRSTHPHLTRTRRRALAVPFVITFAAAGAACGTDAQIVRPGGQPVTTDVISNPAEPEPDVTISNPAEPPLETMTNPPEVEPESEREVMISNPAEPEPEVDPVPDDDLLVIANPEFPEDG